MRESLGPFLLVLAATGSGEREEETNELKRGFEAKKRGAPAAAWPPPSSIKSGVTPLFSNPISSSLFPSSAVPPHPFSSGLRVSSRATAASIGTSALPSSVGPCRFSVGKMKFGSIYEEYLRAEQDKYLAKCSHVEYKRLKKVLKRCRVGRSLQAHGTNGDQQQEGSDESSGICECNSCTLCDQMFFTELTKRASEIAGCFSSRVQRLLHLHVPSGLQRYIWRVRQCFIDDQQIMVQEGRMLLNYVTMNAIAIRKILKKYDKIHGSVSGRDFKSKMQTEHIELLQSPWLIELGAFHLNCDGSDIDEPVGFFKNEFLKNFSCDLTGAQPLMTMTISETMKYEYSLTCPICLDTLFNPYALSCGHLFCKGCACGAASVYIFQGVRSAPPEANCPTCRAAGVFAHAVHMTELDLLIKTRSKDYWRQRLREERTEMVKQSKEYWESQAMLSMGI